LRDLYDLQEPGGLTLKQNKKLDGKGTPSDEWEQLFRVYQIEPIGWLLSVRFQPPLLVVWLLFVVLYFGVLFIMYGLAGTPQPPHFSDMFRQPSASSYYPNLNAIAYDVVGNPLLLALLVFFPRQIPAQFAQLKQSGFIDLKPATSWMDKALHYLGTKRRIQRLTVIGLPLLAALLLRLFVDTGPFSPQAMPSLYTEFLSFLGRYGRAAALVQFGYIFITIANLELKPEFHFNHPDECSGLAPFGRLATLGYAYLFVHMMVEAIGITTGDTAFGRVVGSISGPYAPVFLGILFPIAAAVIFGQLLYAPHCVLRKLQEQTLLDVSTAWTKYHKQVTSCISEAVRQSNTLLTAEADHRFADDWELLETWTKLNKCIEDVHTWPIPKRTIRIVATLGNPLIPVLLPLVVDALKNFLP
jgi:hypothetical protein